MSDDKKPRMKPLFLIPPKSMSAKDIRRAERLAGIVIAECSDAPSARLPCERREEVIALPGADAGAAS